MNPLWVVGAFIAGAVSAYVVLTVYDPSPEQSVSLSTTMRPTDTTARPDLVPESYLSEPDRDESSPSDETSALTSSFEIAAATYASAANATEEEIIQLLDEASQIRPASNMQSVSGILYSRYAQLNPQAAMNHILGRHHVYEYQWIMLVFQSWSRTDIDGAIAQSRLLSENLRSILAVTILYEHGDLTQSQRRSLGHWAMQSQMRASYETARALAYDDVPIEEYWRQALTLVDPEVRGTRLYTVAQLWGRRDPEAALAALDDAEINSLRPALKNEILKNWAEQDPAGASDWVLNQPHLDNRTAMISSLAEGWVKTNPNAALLFLDHLDGSERRSAYQSLTRSWAMADPVAAANWSLDMSDGRIAPRTYDFVARQYAQLSPDDAYRWVVALPPQFAQAAIGTIVTKLANRNPAGFATEIETIENAEVRGAAAESLMSVWSRRDPAAAERWISTSVHEQPKELYANLLIGWYAADADAATQYAQSIVDPAIRRYATTQMAVTSSDIEMVERVYNQTSDSAQRRQLARKLYYAFRTDDPARAEPFKLVAGID